MHVVALIVLPISARAIKVSGLADSETTRAGDDRLPHTELFVHRHEDHRCRVVKVLGDLRRIGRL